MKAQEPVLFEAVIVPHRSLSVVGLRILLAAVLAACVGSSTAFVLLGAWPVGVFAGLELVLAAVLFRLHMNAARASELLLLTPAGLRIVRTSARGRVETRDLPADWMAVRLEERHGRVPALVLQRRGSWARTPSAPWRRRWRRRCIGEATLCSTIRSCADRRRQ